MWQAAGSWSLDACCAVHGNGCIHDACYDLTSSSDWLFGLRPGPPQRFEPTGTDTFYQNVRADEWPQWGSYGVDLSIGITSGAPGGANAGCDQGDTYRGTEHQICGGDGNWGATDVEVWYPEMW